ncbi:hypothetical protein PO909_009694 [Leuciscus waleckii]
MPRPLLPWLRPAPAPIAAATVRRSSSVKPTCTSGAFRLGPQTRTSSNSANRMSSYMSSCSIPIYSCKDTGAHIQERMQSWSRATTVQWLCSSGGKGSEKCFCQADISEIFLCDSPWKIGRVLRLKVQWG